MQSSRKGRAVTARQRCYVSALAAAVAAALYLPAASFAAHAAAEAAGSAVTSLTHPVSIRQESGDKIGRDRLKKVTAFSARVSAT